MEQRTNGEYRSSLQSDLLPPFLPCLDFDSILGMYLFGGKFCKYTDSEGVKSCTCEMIITKDERCECDRKHFNNILWATVTVFQVRPVFYVCATNS